MRLPVAGGWPRQLTTFEDRAVRELAPAPDGATIVFTADRDGDERYQLLAIGAGGGWPEAPTGSQTGPQDGAADAQHHLAEYASWDPAGRRLAFAANSRRLEWSDTPEGDIERVAGDPAGQVLVWLANEDGWGRLYGRDLRTGHALPAADLPPGARYHGTMLTVSGDGRYAALLWCEPTRTDELYLVELATGRSHRLTDNMLGGLAPKDLAAPALIRYRNAEDRPVPGRMYRPRQPGRRCWPSTVVRRLRSGPPTSRCSSTWSATGSRCSPPTSAAASGTAVPTSS